MNETITETPPQVEPTQSPPQLALNLPRGWSEREKELIGVIVNNPANQSTSGGTLDWAASHRNNQAQWDELIAGGRNERSIRGVIYTAKAYSQLRERVNKPKTANSWLPHEDDALRAMVNNPANKGPSGNLTWKHMQHNNPNEFATVMERHSVFSAMTRFRQGLSSKNKTRQSKPPSARAVYQRKWYADKRSKAEQGERVTNHHAEPATNHATEIKVRFCPECGANILGYIVASKI